MSRSPAYIALSGQQEVWTRWEVNLGSTPKHAGSFVITDDAISTDSVVVIQQAAGPYTDKGTLGDEAEMDPIWAVAQATAENQATVWWATIAPAGRVGGFVAFDYTVAG